ARTQGSPTAVRISLPRSYRRPRHVSPLARRLLGAGSSAALGMIPGNPRRRRPDGSTPSGSFLHREKPMKRTHSRLGPKLRGAWSRWQAALWSWRTAGRIWQNLWAARAEQGRRGSLFPRRHPEIDNLEFRSFPGNVLGGAVGATVLGP